MFWKSSWKNCKDHARGMSPKAARGIVQAIKRVGIDKKPKFTALSTTISN
jgi:hypothetical protein